MKKIKKYYGLIFIGLLITNFDFILNRYIAIDYIWLGILKGTGIGMMLLGFFLILKYKKEEKITHHSNKVNL